MENPNSSERNIANQGQEGLSVPSSVEFMRRLGQQLEGTRGQELIEGLDVFWKKTKLFYDQYWDTEVSKSGNLYHQKDEPFRYFEQKDELESLTEEDSGVLEPGNKVAEDAIREIYLSFDLYACIKGLQPDLIIPLVNGAVRMAAMAKALGIDSENYLSIHRQTGDEYRKSLPAMPIYHGKTIERGSKVLLLEDTSSLEGDRTYRDARTWLEGQGVSDVPVFLEFVTAVNPHTEASKDFTDQQFIDIQEELNRENCYNSFNRGAPKPDSKFWTETKSKLSEITEQNPNLYDSFFELIRDMKKEIPE